MEKRYLEFQQVILEHKQSAFQKLYIYEWSDRVSD